MSQAPELYITIELEAGANAAAALDAALSGAPVASVLLRAGAGEKIDAGVAKTMIGVSQKRGVAGFIAGDANLARMVKADGLHLPWSKDIVESYREARGELGDHAMIGADAGRSRDAAMELGEAGADYIAFGIPPHVEDRATAQDRQCDLIAWWSEIFEIPCVAFDVASLEQAQRLARAGADFIAVTVSAALPAEDVKAHVAAFAAAILPAGVAA